MSFTNVANFATPSATIPADAALTTPVTRATFDEVFVPTYAPAAFVPVRGAGLEIWDQSGKRFLDFTAGIAVSSLGHCHPVLVQALRDQSEKLWHLSNAYTNEQVLRLGLALTSATFAEKVFFCNSGAEANEAAFKLARKYASKKHGDKKHRIVSCLNAFHGRTLFTVSVGGQSKYTEGFEPLPPALDHIPFNDIQAARAAITDDVCAVVVEPIQGEGGVVPATLEYLQALRELCNQTGALLIFDEVQSGVGRTGYLYAYQSYGITPDILTSAKALGNGYPIGAMLTTDEIASVFVVGTHGTTYGGNPMAATVALNVLNIINQPAFLARVKQASEKMVAMLEGLVRDYPQVFTLVRGSGLLLGMALAEGFRGRSKDITRVCEANGLMLLVAGPDVLRLAPALIITDEQISEGERIMRTSLDQMLAAAK
jgi:acetylornithine/N-succinyldiaminopimelate aminotransferase